MKTQPLGRTDLQVSALGFGCGAVGGLMVRGDRREQLRTIARAVDGGVTYFDTAALYGNGASEENLGAVLTELSADVVVGTKVRLKADDFGDLEAAVARSVETSLRHLRRDRIDLMQLHNSVASVPDAGRGWVGPAEIQRVIAVFRRLQGEGKIRYWGINGLGETEAIETALALETHSAQICCNLLNPSAVQPVPDTFPYQDYRQLMARAAENGIGVIAIRVLAGGALTGSADRHPNAAQSVAPIGSGASYAADLARARQLRFLVDEGYAETIVEAAIRFVLGNPHVATTLVGIASYGQFDTALAAAEKGALPADALARIAAFHAES